MHRGYLKTAAFLGALSVTLGALTSHQLKNILTEYNLSIFETGVKYQFYHVFALALAAFVYERYPNKFIKASGILFILGIVFFSGSLYGLTYALHNHLAGFKWLGPITPLGGVLFIFGWLCLSLGVKYDHDI